jgi:hypothetical protein
MMCKLDLVQMLYLRLVLFGTGLNAAVGLIAKLHIFLQESFVTSELFLRRVLSFAFARSFFR